MLNVGTLARVYHAKQLPAERDVALKVLLTRYASRPEMRHAMHKDGTELSRMQHPGMSPFTISGMTTRAFGS